MSHPIRRPLLIVLIFLLAACAGIPATDIPIKQNRYPGPDSRGKSLVIFMPGYRDSAEVFAHHNFVGLLNHHFPHVDAIAVDSHIGYFEREQLIPRISEDVIGPAVNAGYERIVLVGVSLGGLGVIWTAHQLRDQIDGLVLIAPFLGRGNAIDRIAQYGSLRAWVDTIDEVPTRSEYPWVWLSSLLGEQRRRPVVLAYGRADRMAPLGGQLATELPETNVFTSDGGHKWVVWKPLWERVLLNAGDRLFPK